MGSSQLSTGHQSEKKTNLCFIQQVVEWPDTGEERHGVERDEKGKEVRS